MGYPIQTVDFPTDTFTQLLGINDAGTIVGLHGAANQGFSLVLPNSFTAITPTGAVTTDVVGINNHGVTDGFFVDANGVTHGFIDNAGVFTNVDAPGSAFNQLLGINDQGQAAGYSSTDPAGMVNQLAYVRQADGTINYIGLPTNVNSQATGINDPGTVVGFFMPTATTSDGFILQNGQLTTLEAPGSTFTQALGENNLGQVVGFYNDAAGISHGFVYSHGTYTTIDVPGASATTINGINDFGQIVGFDTNAAGNVDGFTAHLPELSLADTTTGVTSQQVMTPYSGPVAGLADQFINITADNVNMATTQANVFLRSGSGEDALQVSSGRNVLDGGTGSNFLVGGSGTDTFFVDGRGGGTTWSTVANFHAGDDATIWGWVPGVSKLSWADNQGAAGYQGATLHADLGGTGHINDSMTFSGFSTAQASHFTVSTGTVGGNSYLHIAA